MTAPRMNVEFESRGATLRGWLYRGDAPSPGPAVVMAHGLSGVKEMFLDDYAEAFAHAGLTSLVYDHFGLGESDGAPRQSPAADIQLQGYRDAVAWLAGQEIVQADRIGLWGTSLSGGEVITLASEDISIACAVVQVPYLGEGAPDLPAGALAAITRAVETERTDAMLPVVTATPDGEGAMFADGAFDWCMRIGAERAPNWRNELLIDGFVNAAAHLPINNLGQARVPLLLIVAPGDNITPPGPAMPIAAGTTNVSVVEIPGNHFDAYESGFQSSSEAAIDWFRTHLNA